MAKQSFKTTAWIGVDRHTPLGPVWAGVSDGGLVAVDIRQGADRMLRLLKHLGYAEIVEDQQRVQAALEQIGEYLAGKRQTFNLPIDWSVMLPFQEEVLRLTYGIPYGQTLTYGEIAHRIGRPRSARAVGRAQATNPMPLVIPCHRVLGSDGGLHGYGAGEGLATKAWLLEMEAETLTK